MKFLIKVQFYQNFVPTAVGYFTIDMPNKRTAILSLARQLKSQGYTKNEARIISAEPLTKEHLETFWTVPL